MAAVWIIYATLPVELIGVVVFVLLAMVVDSVIVDSAVVVCDTFLTFSDRSVSRRVVALVAGPNSWSL